MTQEEAIERLERLKRSCRDLAAGMPDEPGWTLHGMALDMALTALRHVSREQVETAWKGCKHCTEEWGTCDPITNRFRMPPRGGIQFCPMCGRPLTDEAVDMLMERLEALHDNRT